MIQILFQLDHEFANKIYKKFFNYRNEEFKKKYKNQNIREDIKKVLIFMEKYSIYFCSGFLVSA